MSEQIAQWQFRIGALEADLARFRPFVPPAIVRPDSHGVFPQLVGWNLMTGLPASIWSHPFYGDIALGNGTQWRICLVWAQPRRLFLGIELHGAYTFEENCITAAIYVQEKLRLSQGDAGNVADLLNDQLAMGHTRQGHYQIGLCHPGRPEWGKAP